MDLGTAVASNDNMSLKHGTKKGFYARPSDFLSNTSNWKVCDCIRLLVVVIVVVVVVIAGSTRLHPTLRLTSPLPHVPPPLSSSSSTSC